VSTDSTETSFAPKACPFCASLEVKTTSKEVNASTYWRCTACGQIWNAGRLSQGRQAPSGRYYR
jgi:transposase-like protein